MTDPERITDMHPETIALERTKGEETITATLPPPTDIEMAMIRKLTSKLPVYNEVRKAAESWLEWRSLSSSQLENLLAALGTPSAYRWREQVVAAWMLGLQAWRGETRNRVQERLSAIIVEWAIQDAGYRALRALAWSLFSALAVLFILMVIGPLSGNLFQVLPGVGILMGLFWAAGFPILTMQERRQVNQVRFATLVSLGRLKAVESLPVLAQFVKPYHEGQFMDPDLIRELSRRSSWALSEVLSCVTEADYGRFTPTTLQNLCLLLERTATETGEPIALALLAALGKIGGGSAAAPVERVAATAGPEALRGAAIAILPLLKERGRREAAAQTLLRAAAGGNVEPEALLRAAGATEPSDPLPSFAPVMRRRRPMH